MSDGRTEVNTTIWKNRMQLNNNFDFDFLVHFQGPTEIKRATTEKLREVFQKYASQRKNGEHFMTSEDFIRGYLGLFPEENFNKARIDSLIFYVPRINDFVAIAGICNIISGHR